MAHFALVDDTIVRNVIVVANGAIDDLPFPESEPVAQAHVSSLLAQEAEMISNGQAPSHDMVVGWLHGLADQFAGCAGVFAEARGLLPLDNSSLIEIGAP